VRYFNFILILILFLSFSFCSKSSLHPTKNFDMEKARQFSSQHHLRYYNPEIHNAAFILPTFVTELLNQKEDVSLKQQVASV